MTTGRDGELCFSHSDRGQKEEEEGAEGWLRLPASQSLWDGALRASGRQALPLSPLNTGAEDGTSRTRE